MLINKVKIVHIIYVASISISLLTALRNYSKGIITTRKSRFIAELGMLWGLVVLLNIGVVAAGNLFFGMINENLFLSPIEVIILIPTLLVTGIVCYRVINYNDNAKE